jgi:NAD(P)-dependent dehydrogenase (short-subunit alcohol dehydrogenase family)
MTAGMADPLFDIAGKAILVAGGAGGLGAPMARAFAQRGARVLIGDLDERLAADTASRLRGDTGGDVRSTALNVTSAASCAEAVDLTVANWGRLDGMVNASGVYRVDQALDLDDDAWNSTIEINLTGAFRLARAAGRKMVEQRDGRIVTLASVSSAVANPRYAAYAASKAGVAHLTRVLAIEWAPLGVTVNAIGPAAIPTPLAQPIFDDEQRRNAMLSRIPMGRFGTADDLIAGAIFLLSPGAAFVTGQTLFIDGGRTIG